MSNVHLANLMKLKSVIPRARSVCLCHELALCHFEHLDSVFQLLNAFPGVVQNHGLAQMPLTAGSVCLRLWKHRKKALELFLDTISVLLFSDVVLFARVLQPNRAGASYLTFVAR